MFVGIKERMNCACLEGDFAGYYRMLGEEGGGKVDVRIQTSGRSGDVRPTGDKIKTKRLSPWLFRVSRHSMVGIGGLGLGVGFWLPWLNFLSWIMFAFELVVSIP